ARTLRVRGRANFRARSEVVLGAPPDLGFRLICRVRKDPACTQKVANGLTGDPVPPSTGSGANVITNSYRFNRRAVATNSSRSRHSMMLIPIQFSTATWIGLRIPSQPGRGFQSRSEERRVGKERT